MGLTSILLVIVCLVAFLFIYARFVPEKITNKNLVFENRLLIPPLLEATKKNNENIFALDAHEAKMEFFKKNQTTTWGFNGNYLGPTIRVHTGDTVHMQVKNNLHETITLHWHGMQLPSLMDGGPHQLIMPNATWQPQWKITNEAATLWYHPHTMAKTGEQIYRGLAGLFIIDDSHSDSLALPKEYGVDDIPLIVQDRQFDQRGQFVYDSLRKDIIGHTGMLGNEILVNGTYAPYVDAPAKQIRLRIVNASNARRYNFGFDDNRVFYQIATDGGLLESPSVRRRMVLAPGERAEIVVDLTKQVKPINLISDAIIEDNPVFRSVKHLLRAQRDENEVFSILQIRPQTTDSISLPLPKNLNTIKKLTTSDAVRTRKFLLRQDNSINNKSMDTKRVDEVVHAGDVELWEITNGSGAYHPFHIHGVQFLILGRKELFGNYSIVPDYEQGWKDTVLLKNGETVQLIAKFPVYADSQVPYMFHCHILEHEDMGMMGQFVVVTDPSKAIHLQSPLLNTSPKTDSMKNMHGVF